MESGDLGAFADAVERLLDDDDLRVQLGLAARARVSEELDWASQWPTYVAVFDELLGRPPWPAGGGTPGHSPELAPEVPQAPLGRRFVPLDDPAQLTQYVRDRGRSHSPSTRAAEEAHSA